MTFSEPTPIRLESPTIPVETSIPNKKGTSSLASETLNSESPKGRLIRQPELFKRIAVSPATGARMKALGKIGPQPIRLSAGCLRYSLEEVLAWLNSRRSDGSLHDAKTWPPVWASLLKDRRK